MNKSSSFLFKHLSLLCINTYIYIYISIRIHFQHCMVLSDFFKIFIQVHKVNQQRTICFKNMLFNQPKFEEIKYLYIILMIDFYMIISARVTVLYLLQIINSWTNFSFVMLRSTALVSQVVWLARRMIKMRILIDYRHIFLITWKEPFRIISVFPLVKVFHGACLAMYKKGGKQTWKSKLVVPINPLTQKLSI